MASFRRLSVVLFDGEGSDRFVDVVADWEGEAIGKMVACCGEFASDEVCETDLFPPREIKTGSTQISAMASKVR
jgi:hypothetical protein